MNERWFEDFGEVLDTLYHIMRNSDDDIENQMEEPYKQLAEIYDNVKAEYGYKDRSDE